MSTIAAISTATGAGGIGIIRMSGEECFKILKKIFIPSNTKVDVEHVEGYTIKYGYIIDFKTKEKIDEVLVSFFRAPKSYTTENMCEINSHGGVIVERKILEQCLLNGAKLAEPGEFTKKAFLNGRIDLSQAESVIDIINAKTDREAKASFSQLQGKLSKVIKGIREELLNVMADIEASIDYPEYDIEETTYSKVKSLLNKTKEKLKLLEKSFNSGKILKDGVKTVIIGKPNSGKSSLLNTILDEERAIVSEVEGTTRDTIEEFVSIKGIPLKIIDTAGIRNTDDFVEKIGVEKAIEIAKKSDIIIAIFDSNKNLNDEDKEILKMLENKNAIIILNKIDLERKINIEEIEKLGKPVVEMSTKTREGIDRLYQEISSLFKLKEIANDGETIVSNVRHKNIIINARKNLNIARDTIRKNMPIDIISTYMKEILEELGKITGETVTEDVISEIFSKFCLGK